MKPASVGPQSKGKKNAYSNSVQKMTCPFCPRVFPWASSLQRHMLTHTGKHTHTHYSNRFRSFHLKQENLKKQSRSCASDSSGDPLEGPSPYVGNLRTHQSAYQVVQPPRQ